MPFHLIVFPETAARSSHKNERTRNCEGICEQALNIKLNDYHLLANVPLFSNSLWQVNTFVSRRDRPIAQELRSGGALITGTARGLTRSIKLSKGPVRKVVTRLISTIMAKMVGGRMPRS